MVIIVALFFLIQVIFFMLPCSLNDWYIMAVFVNEVDASRVGGWKGLKIDPRNRLKSRYGWNCVCKLPAICPPLAVFLTWEAARPFGQAAGKMFGQTAVIYVMCRHTGL